MIVFFLWSSINYVVSVLVSVRLIPVTLLSFFTASIFSNSDSYFVMVPSLLCTLWTVSLENKFPSIYNVQKKSFPHDHTFYEKIEVWVLIKTIKKWSKQIESLKIETTQYCSLSPILFKRLPVLIKTCLAKMSKNSYCQ